MQTTILGRAIQAAIIASGGSCRTLSGLRVCKGGWVTARLAKNGGTTYGRTYVHARANDSWTKIAGMKNLLNHENEYVRQYRRNGPLGFAVKYGIASALSYLLTGSYACGNVYEIAAGLGDGNYGNCK